MSNKPIARRGVLALLGSAPFAAKEIAATKAAEVAAGVKTIGERGRSLVTRGHFRYSDGDSAIQKKVVGLLLRGEDIPAHIRKEWLDDAKSEAHILDPDLACMRSLSLGAKIRIQTERNYAEQKTNYIESMHIATAWEAFKKAIGAGPHDGWDD